MNNYLRVYKSV